jgi:hypothetical protein
MASYTTHKSSQAALIPEKNETTVKDGEANINYQLSIEQQTFEHHEQINQQINEA